MTKYDLQQRVKTLKLEMDRLSNTPKRFKYGRHDIDIAVLNGRIIELEYLMMTWSDGMTSTNVIEQ